MSFSGGKRVAVGGGVTSNKGGKLTFKTVFTSSLLEWPTPLSPNTLKDISQRALQAISKYISVNKKNNLKTKTDTRDEQSTSLMGKKSRTSPNPIVVGINKVNDLLSQRKLSLILAFKDDLQHPQVLNHLPFQCKLYETTLVSMAAGTSEEFQTQLNIKKFTSVIGFRLDLSADEGGVIERFVSHVRSMVPMVCDSSLMEYRSVRVERKPIIPNEKRRRRKLTKKVNSK